jgi:hypothetical protein
VREPWPSKTTGASLVYGIITPKQPLILSSAMADNGVIFSDGMEMDYLAFNAGAVARSKWRGGGRGWWWRGRRAPDPPGAIRSQLVQQSAMRANRIGAYFAFRANTAILLARIPIYAPKKAIHAKKAPRGP